MSIRVSGYVDFRSRPDCLIHHRTALDATDPGATCPRCGERLHFAAQGRIYAGGAAQQPAASALRDAYVRLGPTCGRQLDGDWVLAACCLSCRYLDLIRDATGMAQVYYTWRGGRFNFAGDPADLIQRPEIDQECLARVLASVNTIETATVFSGVYCLPPAHRLTVTPDGLGLHRYWSTADVPPLLLRDRRVYNELLGSALVQAVESRLPASGQTGVMLSAGLDSSIVTAVAAPLLDARARRLVALTHVPDAERLGEPFDEGRAARELASLLPAVDHHRVPSGRWTPVRALRTWSHVFRTPVSANSNAPFLLALLEQAQRCGVDHLLTGQMGNLTMNWGNAGLGAAALFREGHYRAAARHIAGPFRRWVHEVVGVRPRGPARVHPSLRSTDSRRNWRHRRDQGMVFGAARMGGIYGPIGRHFGLDISDPFLARPLVELVASLPPALWAGPQDRWPFRIAMESRLPDAVRFRRWKGVQSADFGRRLAGSAGEVSDLFDELEASPSAGQYVDLSWCRRAVSDLSAPGNARGDGETASWLMLGLEVALFLARADRGDWTV